MFQSLFLWNSLNGPTPRRRSRPRKPCFNPCFCGIRSTATRRGRAVTAREPVSILVFVEFAQRQRPTVRRTRPARTCFNPCFCGIRSTARCALARIEAAIDEFQSLFLWNSLNGDGAGWQPAGRLQCFNPCFCGIRSTARRRWHWPVAGRRDVSILVFVEFAQRRCAMAPMTVAWRRVSILVFVEFAQRRSDRRRRTGSTIGVSILVFVEFAQRPRPRRPRRCAMRVVSILVFVEFAQRHAAIAAGVGPSQVSILVFVEFAQRRGSPTALPCRPSMFQSLFLWNSLNGAASSSAVTMLKT